MLNFPLSLEDTLDLRVQALKWKLILTWLGKHSRISVEKFMGQKDPRKIVECFENRPTRLWNSWLGFGKACSCQVNVVWKPLSAIDIRNRFRQVKEVKVHRELCRPTKQKYNIQKWVSTLVRYTLMSCCDRLVTLMGCHFLDWCRARARFVYRIGKQTCSVTQDDLNEYFTGDQTRGTDSVVVM